MSRVARLRQLVTGGGLTARAMRGSLFSVGNIVANNLLRLGSNLILTRLLFPEAFGLMALVQVFIGGLKMFSDIGIKTSIMQSGRGDDPDFLNMAWTVQILRGVLLWLLACAIARPVATLYEEPMLAFLLPVVGFSAVISGLMTTNVHTASRHLFLGRQTVIDLSVQAAGVCVMVTLAWILQSVWALVIGGLFSATAKVIAMQIAMPGIRNRLHWDRDAFWELIGFGQYIFLATVAGFFINQGDRAILGAYISTGELGVYAIGFLIGTLPFTMAKVLSNRVVLPIYRMRPPAESAANRAKMLRGRRLVVAATLSLSAGFAFVSVPMIDLLYDPRYALAGPMVCLFGLALVPQLTFSCYDSALLANGDSRRFFLLMALTALLQTGLLFLAVQTFGIPGAILSPPLAALAAYPLRVAFLRLYAAQDIAGDLAFLAGGFALNALACWIWWEDIAQLFG